MLINHCRFGDSKGVNYLQFLEQLQPTEVLEDKYKTRMTAKRETVKIHNCCILYIHVHSVFTTHSRHCLVKLSLREAEPESVLEKIKTKVSESKICSVCIHAHYVLRL